MTARRLSRWHTFVAKSGDVRPWQPSERAGEGWQLAPAAASALSIDAEFDTTPPELSRIVGLEGSGR